MEKAVETETISSVASCKKDDVVEGPAAQARTNEKDAKTTEDEIPLKKRKTRRGKSKRRNVHPYKTDMKAKLIKPEAPYNSNRFLIEDHGNIEELDERLNNVDQVSNSTVTRTRDSSFSVDSDGEFYSTPDDEEEYLIKDFDDQYQTLLADRFQNMSKNELIQEYLHLENKVEALARSLRLKCDSFKSPAGEEEANPTQFQEEIDRLTLENEALKRENITLKNKLSQSCSSDSEDSETDSSDSCSSSSSTSSMSHPESPPADFSQMNGHSTAAEEV